MKGAAQSTTTLLQLVGASLWPPFAASTIIADPALRILVEQNQISWHIAARTVLLPPTATIPWHSHLALRELIEFLAPVPQIELTNVHKGPPWLRWSQLGYTYVRMAPARSAGDPADAATMPIAQWQGRELREYHRQASVAVDLAWPSTSRQIAWEELTGCRWLLHAVVTDLPWMRGLCKGPFSF